MKVHPKKARNNRKVVYATQNFLFGISETEELTMCLAAKTPSTIAQQKEATTPKLMKTMDATSCNTGRNLLYSAGFLQCTVSPIYSCCWLIFIATLPKYSFNIHLQSISVLLLHSNVRHSKKLFAVST